MSLIADALKAAQGDTGPNRDPSRSSQRAVAAAMLTASPKPARSGSGKMPKSLGMATAVFGVALAVSVGVVALAPENTRPVESDTDSRSIRDRISALSAGATAEPAQAAAPDSVPAPASAVPSPAGGDAMLRSVATNPVGAASAMLTTVGAAADGSRARLTTTPGRVLSANAGASESAAVPAPAPAAQPRASTGGRFEIVVEPAGPSGEDLFSAAVIAHRRNDLAQATTLYEQVLAQNPRNAQALNNLGSAFQSMGRGAQARDAFRRAIDLNVRDAGAWANLGSVLATLGERQEAQAALGEAIRLDPSNNAAKVNLANQYIASGLAADARILLEEVVGADVTHAEAHYALGRLLEGQGDRTGATRHYRTFLENARGRFPQLEAPVRQRIQQLSAS